MTREQTLGILKKCEEACADYINELPLYTTDLRDAAIVAWVLAWAVDNYATLPYFWQRCVSVVLQGCRFVRTNSAPCQDRGPEVHDFCVHFIEMLWEKKSRKEIGLWSMGYRVTNTKLYFSLAYDVMWTIIGG